MRSLRARLQEPAAVLSDGGWGTMLMARGLKAGECPERWNLERPEELTEIAAQYFAAGAELITTNTFGGSPPRLHAYGLDGETEAINSAGVEAVRTAVGDRAWVNASVGPTGRLLTPYGDTEPEVIAKAFRRQVTALAGAGADLICVETMIDLTEATLAVKAARAVAPEIPVMATMTFDATPRGFFTVMGVTVKQAAAGLEEAGADIVGSNCGHGIDIMVEIAREFALHTTLPIGIQSNAGLPQNVAGEVVYPDSPEHMADKARELMKLGVKIIGGCCGTGSEHIRALRSALDA